MVEKVPYDPRKAIDIDMWGLIELNESVKAVAMYE